MAVSTSVFGGVRLSDDDAKAFRREVENGRPNPEACDALQRGRVLREEYDKNGSAKVVLGKL